MSITKHQVNVLVGYMVAIYHRNGWPVPKGLAPYSGTVGTVKRAMIRRVQTTYKLKVTGEFDSATQKFLTPVDPRQHKAAAAVTYCTWGVNHHGSFVYDQARPISNPPQDELYTLPRGGRRRDCSAFAEDAEYVGFGKSVDGYSFGTGYGNSDSMIAALPHVSIASLRQADLVAFTGPGHVVVITGPHPTNPTGARWVASNGHQGAPEIVSLQREIDSHGSYVGLAVD